MPFLGENIVVILNLPNECVPTSDVTEFKTRCFNSLNLNLQLFTVNQTAQKD